MKPIFKISMLSMLSFLLITEHCHAQYAAKKVRSVHQVYTDSLKNLEYNYILPIWGQGAYSKGFDIPYSIGVMTNVIWLDQGIRTVEFGGLGTRRLGILYCFRNCLA